MGTLGPVVAVGVLLVALLALLVGIGVTTARPPSAPLPTAAEHLTRWSRLHADIDPRRSRWVTGWLRLMFVLARPFARRGVDPDVLTLSGLWWALLTAAVASAGGRWPLVATGCLILGGVADGLDGTVAVLTDRAGPWGGVLDSVVDRLSDLVLLAALVLLPGVAGTAGVADVAGVAGVADVMGVVGGAVAAAVALWTLEYLRARAAQVGADLAVVTVGERPTRMVLVGVTLWCAGLFPGVADVAGLVGLWAVAAVSVIGVVQLAVAVRRELA